jgi:hypothetical protein
MVEERERKALVASVEKRIAELYPHRAADAPPAEQSIDVVHPPEEREGYTEQVITTYEKPARETRRARDAKRTRGA